MLVSRDEPTQELLVAACEASTRLGSYAVDGSLADGDNAVELSATVSEGEPFLAMFAPRSASASGAVVYADRLGLAAPLDDDGRCWLTAMSMPGGASDEEILAALEVVAWLARDRHGYLVVNGEYTPLEGVPGPAPAPSPEPEPESEPESAPEPTVFARGFFPRPLSGAEGWQWLYDRLQALAGAALAPEVVKTAGGTEPFVARPGEAPSAWPLGVSLHRSQPWARWSAYGARFAHDRYSELAVAAELAPAAGEELLDRVLRLVDDGVEYAAVQLWHDDDAAGPGGLRVPPGPPVAGEPRRTFSLTARRLREWLPDLYWAQILGPPWVALFGEERLATTPAYRVEEVAPGHWLVQLTEHLGDVVSDREAYVGVRAKAKRHLGEDCFFDPARGPGGDYRAAVIPSLGERGLA